MSSNKDEEKKVQLFMQSFDTRFKEMEKPLQATEVIGKNDWISFGPKNDLPQVLLQLHENSMGLHKAIIKKKVDMVAGLGFLETPGLKPFLENALVKEDLNKAAYKVAYDLVLFGGYYLNIVWDANGKAPCKIKHVPYEKVRPQIPTEDGEIQAYYISRDWLGLRKTENKPALIPAFASDDEEYRINCPSQLLFCSSYSPGIEYFSLPSYYTNAFITWLRLSTEIPNFHLKAVINSYMPGLIISMGPIPPPEEREQMTADVKRKAGTDTANENLVVYYDNVDLKPEFTLVPPSTTDQRFKDIMATMVQECYTAHGANPIIAGVATNGNNLGSGEEIREAYSNYQATTISPLQKEIENTFSMIAQLAGYADKMVLNEYQPFKVEPAAPAPDQPAPTQPTTPTV